MHNFLILCQFSCTYFQKLVLSSFFSIILWLYSYVFFCLFYWSVFEIHIHTNKDFQFSRTFCRHCFRPHGWIRDNSTSMLFLRNNHDRRVEQVFKHFNQTLPQIRAFERWILFNQKHDAMFWKWHCFGKPWNSHLADWTVVICNQPVKTL